MGYADSVVGAESGGNPTAQNPRSSAYGAGQFIAPTWLNLIAKYRPELANSMSQQDLLGLRADPNLSRQMVDAYGNENAQTLTSAGFQDTPGNRYLAHFAGPAGATKVLGADPSTPAAVILGQSAAQANPFLANMTAGDLVNWASRKIGESSGGGAPSQPVAPSAMPTGMPLAAPSAPADGQSDASDPYAALARLQALRGQMNGGQQSSQDQPPFIQTPAYQAQQRLARLQFPNKARKLR